MSIQVKEENAGKIVAIHLTGKLVKDDYGEFATEFERLYRQNGKLRVLLDMNNFQGWHLGAMWEEVKFDIAHRTDLERLAMVGQKWWERGMAALCNPFTKATIRHFDQIDEARNWLLAKD